jgi:zinc protease
MSMLTCHAWMRMAAVWLLLILSAAAAAQTVIPAAERVVTVEGITEYRLANGLKILLSPDPSKATVSVEMVYLAGTRHERVGEAGTAKMLQRLFSKGTTKNAALDKELSRRGARVAGTAKQDHTHYAVQFQANDENLEWVLQMEADRMTGTNIVQKDIDAEVAALAREADEADKKRDVPFVQSIRRMEAAWNNFGTTLAGEREAFGKLKAGDIANFYRSYYQPDNAVLMVTGKFDETRTLAWLEKYFGAISKPTRALPKPDTRIAFQAPDNDAGAITAGYKMPPALHPDTDALRYAFFVLVGLRDLPVKNKGGLYGGSSMDSNEGGVHIFGVNGTNTTKTSEQTRADLGEIDKRFSDRLQSSEAERKRAIDQYFADEKARAIRQTQNELMALAEELQPPTAEEMQRARQHFVSEAARLQDNHEKFGAKIAEYIALGDWRLFFHARDRAEKVTADEVKAAAAKYYRPGNRVAGILRTQDQGAAPDMIAAPAAAEVLKSFIGRDARFAAAQPTGVSAPGLDRVIKRVQIGGLSVSLLAKKTDDQAVAFNIRLRNGDEKSLFGKAALVEITGRALDRGSTKFQFGSFDERSRLRMRGDFSAGTANFQTTRPYAAAAVKLAGHIMREPVFPDSGAKTVSDRMLEEISAQKNSPSKVAMNVLHRHFNLFPAGDIRNVTTFEEQEEGIKALKASDLRAFHKQFYSAAQGEVAVVGDFDESEVTAALRDAFGDWTGGAPYTRLATPYKDVAPLSRVVDMPGQESAFFAARLNVNMQDTDADHAALVVANHIFGGAAGFQSRLTSRLRLQDGLAHTVRTELIVNAADRGSAWSAFAFADARDIARIESGFKDEMVRASRTGFTASEVAAAKAAILQQRREQRTRDNILAAGGISNGALAGQLINNSHLGRTFAWSKQFEDKIAALRVDEVNAAFRKHIVPGKVSVVKAGDFTNAVAAR